VDIETGSTGSEGPDCRVPGGLAGQTIKMNKILE
jgi:hypothetical protein